MPVFCYSQNNTDIIKQQTKFEVFTSKTGSITKFIDTNMPDIPISLYHLETGIRTILGEPENAYFYRIEKEETSQSLGRIAMIEYSDLVEINKALDRLVNEVEPDIQRNPDYLENKFITDDGFQIGYFISKGKATWYMKLEKYSSSTVLVKNQDTLVSAFKNAQLKIEELKNK